MNEWYNKSMIDLINSDISEYEALIDENDLESADSTFNRGRVNALNRIRNKLINLVGEISKNTNNNIDG